MDTTTLPTPEELARESREIREDLRERTRGKKYDGGKARYDLLSPEMEIWARTHEYIDGLPVKLTPSRMGELNKACVWEELTSRWGDADSFLHGVVKVLTHGAAKYGDNNWENVEYTRYYNAYRRHVRRGWFAGVPGIDKDTGLHHLLHAGACILIMVGLDAKRRAAEGEAPNPEPSEEA